LQTLRQVWLTALGLFLVTFVVFGRGLLGGFVQWDDDINIYANPHIQGFSAANLRWIFTTCEYPPRYVPLGWLSWAITWQFSGLNPFGYHLTDLLFHAANTVLVFLVIRKLLLLAAKDAPAAAQQRRVCLCSGLGAFLWGVHPFRVESVAWAAGRNYVQPFFFLMIAVLWYLRFQAMPARKGRWKFFWLSVLSFGVSLLSYPIGLPLVAVLVVMDFYPLRRFPPTLAGLWNAAARRIWLEKVPYALVSGLVMVVTVLLRASNTSLGPPVSLGEFGIGARAMQGFYGWAYYLWKPWLPFHLSPVYARLMDFNPKTWPFWLSAAFVIGITMVLVHRRNRWPWALALWISHLVLLVPMLGLMEHPHHTCDRYSYLQGVIWAVLLAAALRKASFRPGLFVAAAVAMAALGVFWAGLAMHQTRVWRNSTALFEHLIRELPDEPCRANIRWLLGGVLAQEGKAQEAAEQYQASLRMKPTSQGHLLLAELLEEKGDWQGALTNCLAALALHSDPLAHAKAGELLTSLGRGAEAIAQYRQALALAPECVPALNNLAWILAADREETNRNGSEAVQLAERACVLTGYQVSVPIITLAAAYAEAGRFGEAIAAAEKARGMAEAAGQRDDAEKIRQFLELYRSGRAYRQPPPSARGPSGASP
jgi:protein O-mannosyl-transferase